MGTDCSLEEYVLTPGTTISDRECAYCNLLSLGYVQDDQDPSSCKVFEPLSVGPPPPVDFIGIIILALICCYCGGKVNKRPRFIKSVEMLQQEAEEAKRAAEEEKLKELQA